MAKRKSIESLLNEVQRQAAEHDAVIYEILFRKAGIGIFWHEEARVTTPEPLPIPTKMKALKEFSRNGGFQRHSEATQQRTKEGLVVYGYYSTLYQCLKAELKRLKKLGEINLPPAPFHKHY